MPSLSSSDKKGSRQMKERLEDIDAGRGALDRFMSRYMPRWPD